jgi:hypothetical protein
MKEPNAKWPSLFQSAFKEAPSIFLDLLYQGIDYMFSQKSGPDRVLQNELQISGILHHMSDVKIRIRV